MDTPHRREVLRALASAAACWGADYAWSNVSRADWRRLWRARLDALAARGHAGVRGAESCVLRVWTVAQWLVEEGHVLRIVGPERGWREQIRAEAEQRTGRPVTPRRDRYTLDEYRRILAASRQCDPRFALLLALGAELRLGQVVRCRRRDLDLAAGLLTVPGAGRKRGAVVVLTPGQLEAARAALAGYLAPLEATGADYPLFPATQLRGGRSGRPRCVVERHLTAGPVGPRWIESEFRAAEDAAQVPHVEGRGWRGLRRTAVDAAKAERISREGLMQSGGWTHPEVPDRIYAEQGAAWARQEAAAVRAKIRGEDAGCVGTA